MIRRQQLGAVLRHEYRMLRVDRLPMVVLIAMPLLVMVFIKPTFGLVLRGQGYRDANGAQLAVPSMAVMFAFFVVGSVGSNFFREYVFETWDRVRASRARPAEVLLGKLIPLTSLALMQQVVLFTAGRLLFGMDIRGNGLELVGLSVALSVCLVSFGVAVVATCSSMAQVNLIQTVGAMVFAGIGGAFTPHELLPAWAKAIAPVTPTYWALRGYRAVLVDSGGTGRVTASIVVLLAMAAVFAAVFAVKFRYADKKAWA